jgi:Leucine-rich repeat (LRR) protein
LVPTVEPPSPVAELGSPKLPSKWLLVGVIIAVLAIAGISVCLATTPVEQVTFPDANLEAAIREVLNKPEGSINRSDLEPLITLVAQEIGISDLTGLEYCVNLGWLYLDDNNISDISSLAGLTNLQELHLGGNNISDISALAHLTNLWYIGLHQNSISDISPLAGLTNLEELFLGGNNISDLSALADLTGLGLLNLDDNSISDISALAGLNNLESLLSLRDNNISDISPLAGLINLQEYDLSGNNISDISPLVANSGLSAGDFVALRDNPLSTTSVNVYIPQLEARGVIVEWTTPTPTDTTQVTFPDANLEAAIREAINKPQGPIYTSDLESLTMLAAQGRRIQDLTGLEYCVNLWELDLEANNISDISSLAGLTNLVYLNLDDNNISDISSLAGLTNLVYLNLWENNISDISPLVENSGLSDGDKVYLSGNPLSTTSVNVYIPQLEQRGVIVSYE